VPGCPVEFKLCMFNESDVNVFYSGNICHPAAERFARPIRKAERKVEERVSLWCKASLVFFGLHER